MPTGLRDLATVQSARKFCEDFLEANGFNLTLNILQKDTIQPEVDYETRQGCYVLSLQLLRFAAFFHASYCHLLCGFRMCKLISQVVIFDSGEDIAVGSVCLSLCIKLLKFL